jgi:hypothetical protein
MTCCCHCFAWGRGLDYRRGQYRSPFVLSFILANWRDNDAATRQRQAMLQRLWSGLLLKYPVTEALKEILAAETGNRLWLNVRPPFFRLPPELREQMLRTWRDLEFPLIDSQRRLLDS